MKECDIGRFYRFATGDIGFKVEEKNWSVGYYVNGRLKEIEFDANIEGVEEIIKQIPLFYDCRLIPRGFRWKAEDEYGTKFTTDIYRKRRRHPCFLDTNYRSYLQVEHIIGPVDGPPFTDDERAINCTGIRSTTMNDIKHNQQFKWDRIPFYIDSKLPGKAGDWWFSVGWCNVGPHASLGVDRNGELKHLLDHELFQDPFLCDMINKDDPDYSPHPADAIINCIRQAQEALRIYDGQSP